MNLPVMTSKEVELAVKAEETLAELPQIPVVTEHLINNGVYYRTLVMLPNQVISGALVKIPTTLMISGNVKVYIGDNVIEVNGYKVIPAQAHRKQIMYATTVSYVTMCFKTDAKTVEEAEEEFTNDYYRLASRDEDAINIVEIV